MGKIALVFIIIVASSTFYITSSVYKNPNPSNQQQTRIDENGKLHVMGIILGESTVRDAELAFRSRTDAAIFLYPMPTKEGEEQQFHGELEAYFPSIADHSKVMLKLITDEASLEQMRQRSTMPRMYPNGVIRMNLGDKDVIGIQKMIIRELILMPSVQITEDILHAQFGDFSTKNKVRDTTTTYHFEKIGLIATINTEGKDKLTFSNPQ